MVAKSNKQSSQKEPKSFRPALTPEGQENRMISLAMDLAEKQLRDGTASAQVQVHFLKLGTEKAQLERTKLEREIELMKAKREQIESAQRSEELFERAIAAMKQYSGNGTDEEMEDDEYV